MPKTSEAFSASIFVSCRETGETKRDKEKGEESSETFPHGIRRSANNYKNRAEF